MALLESSWAHLFREEILHNLPAEILFPLCSKEFGRRTKELYARLGLERALFENVTGALAKLFELDPSKQRLDSVHIFSSMAHLAKLLRLARRRAKEKTEEFRELYRFRAGVEGTMSDLDRITGIKHLRVRGGPQVRLAAVLKATGLNIPRSVAFNKRPKRQEKTQGRSYPSESRIFNAVKEQLRRMYDNLQITGFGIVKICPWPGSSTPKAGW